MGKRRKTGDGNRKQHFVKKGNKEETHRTLLNPDSRDFIYDEVDDFEDGRDQLALSNAKKLMSKKKESYEQVLGIDVSSSDNDEDDGESEEQESDEDELYMEDDIVDEPDFKLPDERAWGKNKWRYIGTDTTDEKIAKKLHSQDEELAKLEEETARKLQERMAAELHDLVADDLILHEEDKPKDVALKSTLEVDLSGLSRTKKLQLLQRESPEFMPLFDDLKEKCEEINSLAVLMEGVKTRQIESVVVSQYITTKYRLTLNYLCVLCMYMFTKCSQSSVGSHPVVSRLAQYRQLLQELKPCDDKLEADLKCLIPEIILARTTKLNPTPNSTKEKPRKQEKLQVLNKKNVTKTEKKKRKLSDLLSDSQMLDDKGGSSLEVKEGKSQVIEASSDEGQEVNGSVEVEENESLDPDGKRAISYQISKNKGLTPSRKKEQRNPRVKYRNKYQTKLKKRKGQVREVRKELKRYEGEVSGIKSHTIKSRKIK